MRRIHRIVYVSEQPVFFSRSGGAVFLFQFD